MIDAFNSWMSSTRAGATYLALVAIGLVLVGIAKLFQRKNVQSQAGQVFTFLALCAFGAALVLTVLAQAYNE